MRVACLMAVCLMTVPAAAEECKVNDAAVSDQFQEAIARLVQYQSYAHLCADVIGMSHAEAGIVTIQTFLLRSGHKETDAVIGADKVDNAAREQAAVADLAVRQSGRSVEAATICLEAMNEAHRLYEVAQAKMLKAGCAK